MQSETFLAVCGMSLALFSAQAAEWHVYSDTREGLSGTQQITNAFACAQDGDVITIHPGVYNVPTEEMTFRFETDAQGTKHATGGICLYSKAKNLTVQGSPEDERTEIVLSGRGASESGREHQVMFLEGSGCTVRHLTFRGGIANVTYDIYRNGSLLNADRWPFRRGGGLRASTSAVVEDCVFDDCYAGQGACVYGASEIRNCVFTGSSAVAKNAGCAVCSVPTVADSWFEGNQRGCLRDCKSLVSNCVFVANSHGGSHGLNYYVTAALVDCVFSNNQTTAAYLHGAKYMPREITRCTFYKNSDSTYSAGIGGTVPCTVPVRDCTFVGAMQASNVTARISGCAFTVAHGKETVSRGILADCPDVEDCVFEGNWAVGARLEGNGTADSIAAFSDCNLVRCSINGFNVRYGPLMRNCRVLRNCLIAGSETWGTASSGGFLLTDGQDVTVENCTITTNLFSNGIYANASTGKLTFKNCLFYNNNVSGKGWGSQDWGEPDAGVYMDHCFFKAPGDWSPNGVTETDATKWTGDGSLNFYRDWTTKPGFCKDARGGESVEHPYALVRRGLCTKKGLVEDWMRTAVDLAGNRRLFENHVDLGCYQNCEFPPGLCISFK